MRYFSVYSKIKSLVVYGLCTLVLIISLINFSENRLLFSLLLISLAFLYWITGFYDEVIISESEIQIVNAHLIPFFKRTKCYSFATIDLVTINAKYKNKDYSYYQYLSFVLPGFFLINNSISFRIKDGSTQKHITQLTKQQLEKISILLKRRSNDLVKVELSYL